MSQLENIRHGINVVDKRIVALLRERFSYVEDIQKIKQENDLPIRDEEREQEVIKNVEAYAKFQGLDPKIASSIYQTIIEEAIEHQSSSSEPEMP